MVYVKKLDERKTVVSSWLRWGRTAGVSDSISLSLKLVSSLQNLPEGQPSALQHLGASLHPNSSASQGAGCKHRLPLPLVSAERDSLWDTGPVTSPPHLPDPHAVGCAERGAAPAETHCRRRHCFLALGTLGTRP